MSSPEIRDCRDSGPAGDRTEAYRSGTGSCTSPQAQLKAVVMAKRRLPEHGLVKFVPTGATTIQTACVIRRCEPDVLTGTTAVSVQPIVVSLRGSSHSLTSATCGLGFATAEIRLFAASTVEAIGRSTSARDQSLQFQAAADGSHRLLLDSVYSGRR